MIFRINLTSTKLAKQAVLGNTLLPSPEVGLTIKQNHRAARPILSLPVGSEGRVAIPSKAQDHIYLATRL